MNGLELAAADLRAIRERVACVASDLEALATSLEMDPRIATEFIVTFLRDKVRELGG